MTWTAAVRPKRAITARGIASLWSIVPVAVVSSSTALVGFVVRQRQRLVVVVVRDRMSCSAFLSQCL